MQKVTTGRSAADLAAMAACRRFCIAVFVFFVVSFMYYYLGLKSFDDPAEKQLRSSVVYSHNSSIGEGVIESLLNSTIPTNSTSITNTIISMSDEDTKYSNVSTNSSATVLQISGEIDGNSMIESSNSIKETPIESSSSELSTVNKEGKDPAETEKTKLKEESDNLHENEGESSQNSNQPITSSDASVTADNSQDLTFISDSTTVISSEKTIEDEAGSKSVDNDNASSTISSVVNSNEAELSPEILIDTSDKSTSTNSPTKAIVSKPSNKSKVITSPNQAVSSKSSANKSLSKALSKDNKVDSKSSIVVKASENEMKKDKSQGKEIANLSSKGDESEDNVGKSESKLSTIEKVITNSKSIANKKDSVKNGPNKDKKDTAIEVNDIDMKNNPKAKELHDVYNAIKSEGKIVASETAARDTEVDNDKEDNDKEDNDKEENDDEDENSKEGENDKEGKIGN